ncbi:hypothetical protein [Legionella sp. 29fVS95]|uniref:hypothetical protein n=1 Tax=Legionella sp. 29fVS95 TaxID=3402813 RepID=UPI003AF8D157
MTSAIIYLQIDCGQLVAGDASPSYQRFTTVKQLKARSCYFILQCLAMKILGIFMWGTTEIHPAQSTIFLFIYQLNDYARIT